MLGRVEADAEVRGGDGARGEVDARLERARGAGEDSGGAGDAAEDVDRGADREAVGDADRKRGHDLEALGAVVVIGKERLVDRAREEVEEACRGKVAAEPDADAIAEGALERDGGGEREADTEGVVEREADAFRGQRGGADLRGDSDSDATAEAEASGVVEGGGAIIGAGGAGIDGGDAFGAEARDVEDASGCRRGRERDRRRAEGTGARAGAVGKSRHGGGVAGSCCSAKVSRSRARTGQPTRRAQTARTVTTCRDPKRARRGSPRIEALAFAQREASSASRSGRLRGLVWYQPLRVRRIGAFSQRSSEAGVSSSAA